MGMGGQGAAKSGRKKRGRNRSFESRSGRNREQLLNANISQSKPLIFLTRSGIFYGWWRCWMPVTSPTMVAIVPVILDFTKNKTSG